MGVLHAPVHTAQPRRPQCGAPPSLTHASHAPLQIGLERVLFKNSGPGKDPIQLGATASAEVPTGDLLVGGGDGSLQVSTRGGGAQGEHEHEHEHQRVLLVCPGGACARASCHGGGQGSQRAPRARRCLAARPQVLKTNPEASPSNPKLLKRMVKMCSCKVEGAITTIVLDGMQGKAYTFLVGTAACNIYRVTYTPQTGK